MGLNKPDRASGWSFPIPSGNANIYLTLGGVAVQIVSEKSELFRKLSAICVGAPPQRQFRTGLDILDQLAPNEAWPCGAVHELLANPRGPCPKSIMLLLARAAWSVCGGAIVWSDPDQQLYPPALAAAGIDLGRLVLLRPRNPAEEIWSLAECLRCRGVGATVATVRRLSRIEARRLQLAAERGGGVGVFLRIPDRHHPTHYAAATRWLVQPLPGGPDMQRWSIQLVHGQGGRIGKNVLPNVLIEVDRETGIVRASAPLANRPGATTAARASA
jgi:protein ImuA